MTIYSEVPVVLRFRADHLITYDEIRHKLQMCGMKGLCEFVVLERPKDAAEESWAQGQRMLDAQIHAVDLVAQAMNRHPIDVPVESSRYRHG